MEMIGGGEGNEVRAKRMGGKCWGSQNGDMLFVCLTKQYNYVLIKFQSIKGW